MNYSLMLSCSALFVSALALFGAMQNVPNKSKPLPEKLIIEGGISIGMPCTNPGEVVSINFSQKERE